MCRHKSSGQFLSADAGVGDRPRAWVMRPSLEQLPASAPLTHDILNNSLKVFSINKKSSKKCT